MAIESGVAIAIVLAHWNISDLKSAFRFYQDLRKPRTDGVTRTSYEAGKLGSSDDPDKFSEKFNPIALMERMKWIMEYSVIDDLKSKNDGQMSFEGSLLA